MEEKGKICAQCKNYAGGGDWGLCCTKKYDLTYEDTAAGDCPNFEQTGICRNVSSYIGRFRCSLCGHFTRVAGKQGEFRPRIDRCPHCGSEVEE